MVARALTASSAKSISDQGSPLIILVAENVGGARQNEVAQRLLVFLIVPSARHVVPAPASKAVAISGESRKKPTDSP